MSFRDFYILNSAETILFPKGSLLQGFKTPMPIVNNTIVTKQKISSFKNLPSGWHYGEGVAPTSAMIDMAQDWHNRVAGLGFGATNAFPGIAGEIMITGRNGAHEVELILEVDGTISFEYDKDDERVTSIECGDAAEVGAALNAAAGELWSTSGSFTSDILNQTKIVLPVWHSEIMGVAHLSFYMNAFKSRVEISAGISERTTPTPPENPQSFGF